VTAAHKMPSSLPDLIILPIQFGRYWSLVTIDFSNKLISYLDSLGKNFGRGFDLMLDLLECYINQFQVFCKTNWALFEHTAHPRCSSDSNSCVLICLAAKLTRIYATMPNKELNYRSIRSQMLNEISSNLIDYNRIDFTLIQSSEQIDSSFIELIAESYFETSFTTPDPPALNNINWNHLDLAAVVNRAAPRIDELPYYIIQLQKAISSSFSLLHLNITSLPKHYDEIIRIVDTVSFDIITLNETKLAPAVPLNYFSHPSFNLLRRDKTRREGGLVVLINKNLKIIDRNLGSYSKLNLEFIYFKLLINNKRINFVVCYKPPHQNDREFLDELEELLFGFDLTENLVVIGDLNLDLLPGNENRNLVGFLNEYNLENHVRGPTHSTCRYFKELDRIIVSESMIDLVLHNGNLIDNVKCIDCPFSPSLSGHKFVVANFSISHEPRPPESSFKSRRLNQNKLLKINQAIDSNLGKLNWETGEVVSTWLSLKEIIINACDYFAPLCDYKPSSPKLSPWISLHTKSLRNRRDAAYKLFRFSKLTGDFHLYADLKKAHAKSSSDDLVTYFRFKSNVSDFKNSKHYWDFYSNYINIKTSKTQLIIDQFTINGAVVSDHFILANAFNDYFTTSSPQFSRSLNECFDFTRASLDKMFLTKPPNFEFQFTNGMKIAKTIKSMKSSSGAGLVCIPTRVFQSAVELLQDRIAELFNRCMAQCVMPTDWKAALVSPLFKNKGDMNIMENYRAISVLPPIAKVFEKILAEQITQHINTNNLLFNGQFGFRKGHSCESALHEIISMMNKYLSKREIGLFLFIDFKKAFDLVRSEILVHKLRYGYGFGESACKLIANYFVDRFQLTKFKNALSEPNEVKLGVPQGSVLGPIFFLLYINDLPNYLKFFSSTLFADDTTIYSAAKTSDVLLDRFDREIGILLEWCDHNLAEINWIKTKIMFIHNKRGIIMPAKLTVNGHVVEVVHEFKLLGIWIDDKLNFNKQTADLRKAANIRLYSIRDIFFLAKRVKIQFFKTFILPIFNYCSSLIIYFPKSNVQKISNCFNRCLHLLIFPKNYRFPDPHSLTFLNQLNNFLETVNLNTFEHHYFKRIAIYIHKLFNDSFSPSNLLNSFSFNKQHFKGGHDLRNANLLTIPIKGSFNDSIEKTFTHFFSKFINILIVNDLNLSFKHFSIFIKNNINILTPIFCENFNLFELKFKHYS
jgi:hypothetical protein